MWILCNFGILQPIKKLSLFDLIKEIPTVISVFVSFIFIPAYSCCLGFLKNVFVLFNNCFVMWPEMTVELSSFRSVVAACSVTAKYKFMTVTHDVAAILKIFLQLEWDLVVTWLNKLVSYFLLNCVGSLW